MSAFKVITEEGKEYQVEASSDQHFTLNGQEKQFDLRELKAGKFHIISGNKSYNLELINENPETKEMTIRVNGNYYQLKVEDRFDLLLHQLGMDDLASAGITALKAPMPGLVLSIEAGVGQAVKKDDPLLVLEAMKMENVLKAPGDLTIKSIGIEQGQAVEKNQLLLEFE